MNDHFETAVKGGDNTDSNTILIVDDDKINRKVLGKIFSDLYSIKEVENGEQALFEILNRRDTYCAVLLDLVMPNMNGIDVLRVLKKYNILKEIPIFLITAEANDTIVMREAYELGVMDIIAKPVIPFIVRQRIQSVIELFETRKYLKNTVKTQQLNILTQAEKIIQLNRGMIEVLSTAIEFRDCESGGHVQRIAGITRFILTNTNFVTGLSEEEIENIALASIMHDVGKIAVPDAILSKPGKLTPQEYDIMKSHTTKGAELLENIPQLHENEIYKYALDIAKHHHERWDGRGYPDGLAKDDITPWAQVVSIADVYDALSCKRVYKNAFPRKQVIDMIKTGQCGVFNPRLLDSFFDVEDELSRMYTAETLAN